MLFSGARAFWLACFWGGAAYACVQPLCVNRSDDSATAPVSGMLRYAVLNAPIGATITFDPALSGQAIALDAGSPNNHIKITQDVTIQGPGASLLTVSGGNATRIFFIANGTVTIGGLTLAKGLGNGGNGGDGSGGGGAGMGGAIFLNGGWLTLNGVVVSGNRAQGGQGGAAGYGGGGGGFGGNGSPSGQGGAPGDLYGNNGGMGGSVGGIGTSGGYGGFGGGGGGGGYTPPLFTNPNARIAVPGPKPGGAGGFGVGGGGGGGGAVGGFGGGNGADNSNGGGGGAGFGGALFASAGTVLLINVSFTGNSTSRGVAGGTGAPFAATGGQAKGGALFVCSSSFCGTGHDARVMPTGSTSFQGNTAADAGAAVACPGQDTADVCGSLTASTPTHFSVTSPSPVTAGVPFSFTVTALDANNNVVFTYAGAVHFSSSDSAAFLPPDSTLASGVGTFYATLKTGASQTITATDQVTGSITGTSAAIQVSSGETLGPAGVSPSSGSGFLQTYTFTFYDPLGWQDLGVVNILVNNVLDGRQACYIAFSQTQNTLYLVPDNGYGPGASQGGLNLSGIMLNSQCGVSWETPALATSGNTLALTLTLRFTNASFAGNKVIYMAAGNMAGNNSGWQAMGVWQVTGGTQSTTTAVVWMNPAQGSGTSQTVFNFNFSDTQGFQDLGVENILVNDFLDGRHACYLAYARPINVLYLVNDTGDALLPGQSLASSGSLSNSQCAVSWGNAPVSAGGPNPGSFPGPSLFLALTLNIAFGPGFGGHRVFYLAARDSAEGNNTGWQAMGTWSVQ